MSYTWKQLETGRIWTNCEHAKNDLQKYLFQNILENTCKNEPGNPLFMRISRGKCRNAGRPFQGIATRLLLMWASIPRTGRNAGRPFQGIATLLISDCDLLCSFCRNAGRPFQGIATLSVCAWIVMGTYSRNAGRPFQGIATSQCVSPDA